HSAAQHFGLHDLGAIAPGRRACIAVLEDLKTCSVRWVYHDGAVVGESEVAVIELTARTDGAPKRRRSVPADSVRIPSLMPGSFAVRAPRSGACRIHVIE